MAICIGCGLEVSNDGVLGVDLCPNGGLSCATQAAPGPDGCTSGLYVKFPTNTGNPIFPPNPDPGNPANKPAQLGCGLTSDATGKITVDVCNDGGLACGDINGDTQCLYVDVQGQGAGPAVPLATAQTLCPSPNCNGLVRTDEGLWAPPKTFGSCYSSQSQMDAPAGAISDFLFFPVGGIPDIDASVADTFPGPPGDGIYVGNGGPPFLAHSALNPDPLCNLIAYGNTYSTFSLSFFVNPGELWRFLLWERAKFVNTAAEANAGSTLSGGPLSGTGWVLQASFYIDRRNEAAGAIHTIQMNDVSTHCEFNTRWEAMVTVRKITPGNGSQTNTAQNLVTKSTFQYRRNTTSSHCSLPVASVRGDGGVSSNIP